MSGEMIDSTPLELSDLINRVLDKGAVIAGSVTISVGDIDLIQLDLTVVLTAEVIVFVLAVFRNGVLENAIQVIACLGYR